VVDDSIGALAPRGSLLDLALLASDNRAASALARHHPGGLEGFAAAMQRKIHALGLYGTQIEEPTGLSPNNVSAPARRTASASAISSSAMLWQASHSSRCASIACMVASSVSPSQ
jgi:D-alanyl-D-alanine carboxypeptidase